MGTCKVSRNEGSRSPVTPLIYLSGSVLFVFSFTKWGKTLNSGSFVTQVGWDKFEEVCEILKLLESVRCNQHFF